MIKWIALDNCSFPIPKNVKKDYDIFYQELVADYGLSLIGVYNSDITAMQAYLITKELGLDKITLDEE